MKKVNVENSHEIFFFWDVGARKDTLKLSGEG